MNKNYKGSLRLDWINKDQSLYYEIDESEGRGIKPIWVPKDDIRVSEPRILNFVKSYGDETSENMLIRGDNLLVLRTLVEQFKNRKEKDKVKCCYIDVPFNTGSAFDKYDDNLQHSEWLTMMRDRFVLLKKLLRNDGCILVHLDDNESAYCKVLLDELFGRNNYCNEIINATNSPFGFKGTSQGLFKQANHIFLYAKDKTKFKLNKVFIEKSYDKAYNLVFNDLTIPESQWTWCNINEVVSRELGYKSYKDAKQNLGIENLDQKIADFAIKNANRVFQVAAVSGGALIKRRTTIEKSKSLKDKIMRHPEDDMDYIFIGGRRVIFYKERLVELNGELRPGQLLTDIWDDISIEGMAREGGVDFPKSKKPEKLLKRILDLVTRKDDLVLDSFSGSGTTGAVAHKIGLRWIMIELGKHADELCVPRLKNVLDGSDQSGISREVNWQGGGGFKYYKLGESLISNKDINWNLTYKQIAEALFYTKNFKLLDEPELAHKGIFIGENLNEKGTYALCTVSKDCDFIKSDEYFEVIDKLKEKYDFDELNLYTNKAVNVRKADQYENVLIRKIPQTILKKYRMI